MIKIRANSDRGKADHGWLKSKHTFSFASYHDPEYMGVSALRVINDDKVAPGQGFATHSHQDMEIISYVKKGTIEHKDSMNNIETLPAGEFQLMTAGTGVTHSEYNPSETDELEFLQIWIEPKELAVTPGYQQKRFEYKQGMQLIASPNARDGSLRLNQDAELYRVELKAEQSIVRSVEHTRNYYIHMVSGVLRVNGLKLTEGDGIAITQERQLELIGGVDVEALFFDLP